MGAPYLYVTLGLQKQATDGEIAKAYRLLALKYHPDRNPDDSAALREFPASGRFNVTVRMLFEKFESKLEEYRGNLTRAAVELAKDWRTDRVLRRLEAPLAVAGLEQADAGGTRAAQVRDRRGQPLQDGLGCGRQRIHQVQQRLVLERVLRHPVWPGVELVRHDHRIAQRGGGEFLHPKTPVREAERNDSEGPTSPVRHIRSEFLRILSKGDVMECAFYVGRR